MGTNGTVGSPRGSCLFLVGLVLLGGCAAGVTVLQNGTSPTPEYAGCRDTWISQERYEAGRDNSGSQTLRCGGKRHVLIRFDLSPVPADHVIHKAVLRLADVGYPRKAADGKWAGVLVAYRLGRDWNDKASWDYHSRKSYKDTPAGAKWSSPGGDLDRETDFGAGEKGLVAAGAVADGPWGHAHELDVTEVVRRWHGGGLPNHGLALAAAPKTGGCTVAASEWHVPACRPKLIVAHGPKGAEPSTIAPLAPCPRDIPLHAICQTPDTGQAAGEYAAVRVGQNSTCALRGASTDAYVKEAVARYPGTWGWMNMCRVGGAAGDVSRALLYFDLRGIPKAASIRQARLVVSLTPYTHRHVGEYRYGAFLLELPGAPGWTAAEATASYRQAGAPWPKGGVLAASGGAPLAVGKLVMKQVADRGGRRQVPGTLEFDLTGAVRAWVRGELPNCGIVLDNRLEGGAYDFYSCRSFKPELRPYLEVALSPAVAAQPEPIAVAPALPPGDYWVQPMRQVHQRFKGRAGTLAQYGDSITVSYAFLAYRFAAGAPANITPPRKQLALENTSPRMKKELERVGRYSDRRLWLRWKGAQWGNTGQMRSDWLLANIDGWQKKMNPEVSVILFGTNDLGGICPPDYTENMAASIRRMLADGTVPTLTTVPPRSGADHIVPDYHLALLSIAHAMKVPVIDYYADILRRRPDDWNGALPKFKDGQATGLISRDGVHPSHPAKYQFDFSEEALNTNGYLLRDYLTIRKYYEVITKVLQPEGP